MQLFIALVAFLTGLFTNWNGFLVSVGDVGPSGLIKNSSSDISSRPSSGDSVRGEELHKASCIV